MGSGIVCFSSPNVSSDILQYISHQGTTLQPFLMLYLHFYTLLLAHCFAPPLTSTRDTT